MSKFQDFFGVILVCLLGSAFCWVIYISLCFSGCDRKHATCTLNNIHVDVAICQDANQNWRPYTGYAQFCLVVLDRQNENATLCLDQKIACGKTTEEALSGAKSRHHVGEQVDCWYDYPVDLEGYWIAVYWIDTMSWLNKFKWMNIICDIILGAAILFVIVLWTVREVKAKCGQKKPRVDHRELVHLI